MASNPMELFSLLPSDFPESIIKGRLYQSQANHGHQEGLLPAFIILRDESELSTDNLPVNGAEITALKEFV